MMKRSQVEQWAEENEVSLILLDGADDVIEGIISEGLENPKVVYSKEKFLKILESEGMSEEEALEHFDYNTIRALPYMEKKCSLFHGELSW